MMKNNTPHFKILSDWGSFGKTSSSIGNRNNRTSVSCDLRLTQTEWYGKAAKWDLRVWSEDYDPGKGITLNTEQIKSLKALLDSIDFEEREKRHESAD